jgi:hypothetical protein
VLTTLAIKGCEPRDLGSELVKYSGASERASETVSI